MDTPSPLPPTFAPLRLCERSFRSRRGLATLELTLAMPFFVLMIALILLTANGMVLSSQTAVDARVDAFKKSLEHKSQTGMDRFLLEDVAKSDRYKRDIINGNASGSLAVVKVFPSGKITSTAQLAVLRNTWSHTELPLNDQQRLPLYGQVVFAGSLGKMGSVIDQLRGLGSNVASIVEGLGQASQATQQDPPGMADARKKQEEARAKRDAEKKRIEGEVARLEGEIRQLNTDITQLRKDNEQLDKDIEKEEDETKKEELEAKKKANEEQIEAKQAEKTRKERELEQRRKELDLIKKSEVF